ncbi:MAG: hypothetical protein JSS00_11865 [Proteobacteria bacterium]|nr:hypothetical protein [Pseudomonadota bacterium]
MSVKHDHGAAVLNADPQWVQEQIAELCNPIRRRQAAKVLRGRIIGIGLLAAIWVWPSFGLAALAIAWVIWTATTNIALGQDQIDSAHAVRLAFLSHEAQRKQNDEVVGQVEALRDDILGGKYR